MAHIARTSPLLLCLQRGPPVYAQVYLAVCGHLMLTSIQEVAIPPGQKATASMTASWWAVSRLLTSASSGTTHSRSTSAPAARRLRASVAAKCLWGRMRAGPALHSSGCRHRVPSALPQARPGPCSSPSSVGAAARRTRLHVACAGGRKERL